MQEALTSTGASHIDEVASVNNAVETFSAVETPTEVKSESHVSGDFAVREASQEFPTLRVETVASYRTASFSDERIREIAAEQGRKSATKTKASRSDLAQLLAEKKDWLLQESANLPLFSAKVVGALMTAAGFYPPVRGYNAYGDKLGKHGHNLPSVVIDGVRRYDLSYLGKTDAEKEARQAFFDSLDRKEMGQLKPLVAKLKPGVPVTITPARAPRTSAKVLF